MGKGWRIEIALDDDTAPRLFLVAISDQNAAVAAAANSQYIRTVVAYELSEDDVREAGLFKGEVRELNQSD